MRSFRKLIGLFKDKWIIDVLNKNPLIRGGRDISEAKYYEIYSKSNEFYNLGLHPEANLNYVKDNVLKH